MKSLKLHILEKLVIDKSSKLNMSKELFDDIIDEHFNNIQNDRISYVNEILSEVYSVASAQKSLTDLRESENDEVLRDICNKMIKDYSQTYLLGYWGKSQLILNKMLENLRYFNFSSIYDGGITISYFVGNKYIMLKVISKYVKKIFVAVK